MKKKSPPIAKPAPKTRQDYPLEKLKLEIITPVDAFGYQIRAGFIDGHRLFAAMPATFVEVEHGQRLPSLLSIEEPQMESLLTGIQERMFRHRPSPDAEVVSLLKAEIAHLREVVLLLAGKKAT